MTDHMTGGNDGKHQADPTDQPEQSDNGDLKQSLINRAAIAGVLIVALLGGLAVLDQLNAPQTVKQTEVSTPIAISEPAPAPPKAEEKPVEPAAEEIAKVEEPAVEPEISAPPTATTKPVRAEHPERPERPLTKSAEPRLAMLKPSEPLVTAKRPEPVTELARTHAPHVGAPASRPLSRATAQTGGILLQLGVFSNIANAEELRAKLELNGIPTQIEARVHVGPFSSSLEVEQVREKLRKLGLQDGVQVATKRVVHVEANRP